jgi:hypothetical protein
MNRLTRQGWGKTEHDELTEMTPEICVCGDVPVVARDTLWCELADTGCVANVQPLGQPVISGGLAICCD